MIIETKQENGKRGRGRPPKYKTEEERKKIINGKRGRGRPPKYKTEEERKKIRREQYRINQIACRKRKKLKKLEEQLLGIGDFSKKDNKENNKIKANKFNNDYRQALNSLFNQYDYTVLFTGTLKPNNNMKKQKKNMDKQIQYHEHIFDYQPKIGKNLFIRKTKEYINYLTTQDLFERCFGVFEFGKKNNQIHVHILFKKKKNVNNFNKKLKSYWKIGLSNTKNIKKKKKNEIEIEDDCVNYCLKELEPLSPKNGNLFRIDSWFFEGNFKRVNNE